MKGIWLIFLELVLLLVGGIIFIILFVLGCIYTFFKHVFKLDYSGRKQLQPIIRSVTLALDGLACAGAGELLNDALKIKGNIKYGKWYQTISAITGLVHIYEKDTWLRRFLDNTLGKNHCQEAITEQDQYYYSNKF